MDGFYLLFPQAEIEGKERAWVSRWAGRQVSVRGQSGEMSTLKSDMSVHLDFQQLTLNSWHLCPVSLMLLVHLKVANIPAHLSSNPQIKCHLRQTFPDHLSSSPTPDWFPIIAPFHFPSHQVPCLLIYIYLFAFLFLIWLPTSHSAL